MFGYSTPSSTFSNNFKWFSYDSEFELIIISKSYGLFCNILNSSGKITSSASISASYSDQSTFDKSYSVSDINTTYFLIIKK